VEYKIKEDRINEKVNNLDSEFFNNQATKIINYKNSIKSEKTFSIFEERKESLSLALNDNISTNITSDVNNKMLVINQNQNIEKKIENTSTDDGINGSFLNMKKIILLEPEFKKKKDEVSMKSFDISEKSK